MDIALISTIAVSAVGATWVLRSKLGDIECALRAHITANEHEFAQLTGRLVKLERRTMR